MRAAFGIDSPPIKWLFDTTLPPPTAGPATFNQTSDGSHLFPWRAIFGISCLLLGAGMLLCQVEGSGQSKVGANQRQVLQWVRTKDGWEQPGSWYLDEIKRPRLHPAVVAAGQGLLSTMGLVLFQQTGERRSR